MLGLREGRRLSDLERARERRGGKGAAVRIAENARDLIEALSGFLKAQVRSGEERDAPETTPQQAPQRTPGRGFDR